MKSVFSLIFLWVATCVGADDPPSWLREAASTALPAYDAKVPASVLLQEERRVVDPSGRITTTVRKAVKVLTREGRGEAMAHVSYFSGNGKVRDLRAWLISPSGETKRYGKDSVVETASNQDSLYNDVRAKMILANTDASPGSTFGYEAISEERSVFTQLDWAFQGQMPALRSRFMLTLPAGWRAESVTFNHGPVSPVISGSEYTWELKNLPYIEDEPASPTPAALVPRLAVSFYPNAADTSNLGPTFKDWADVSRWLTSLSSTQREMSAQLIAKSKELTASATTDYERIQAIGKYVQALKYIAIEMGLAKGGGYKPHEANQVFERQYGDCKDKANLMVAMLKAVGIPAYIVSIYSGDRTYVRQEWPSPQQFNHAIVAVKVGDEVEAPLIVNHPALGHLLIFDATDPYTPVGDLPWHEQGSFGLIEAGEKGALVRMPSTPPIANRLKSTIEVTLSPEGDIQAKMHDQGQGQSAVSARARFRAQNSGQYRESLEKWITHTVNSAAVSHVQASDTGASFERDIEFMAKRYAQKLPGLLILKPAIVSRYGGPSFPEGKRKYAIMLDAEAYQESVTISLPAQFKVDEMPQGRQIETSFGSYQSHYQIKGSTLLFTRDLEIRPATVLPDRYQEIRDFFGHVQEAEQAPVVLSKE